MDERKKKMWIEIDRELEFDAPQDPETRKLNHLLTSLIQATVLDCFRGDKRSRLEAQEWLLGIRNPPFPCFSFAQVAEVLDLRPSTVARIREHVQLQKRGQRPRRLAGGV